MRALGEDLSGSEYDELGFVDLTLCDDLAEIENDDAMTFQIDFVEDMPDMTFGDLAEILTRPFGNVSIVNVREYRAWVGSRSLHIS